jgi:hypothetical protein
MTQPDTVSLGRYETARWWRVYWWFGVAFSGVAGGGLIITALAVRGGASITLAVIGTAWIMIAVFALRSAKRLAWSVDVTPNAIGCDGPRLHLRIPPTELVEVRLARGDIAGRGSHEARTAHHGLIHLGPSRDVSGFFAALRRVNPNVKLPGDPIA